MTTNYDEIAEKYIEAQGHPFKRYVESFSLLRTLGNIQAQSALDLACGDGYYTRLIRQQGAARVVGVDISAAMINTARAIEAKEPLGIEYRLGDVTTLGRLGQFDLVTAIYLFPYAGTRQALGAMARAAADNLKPGGRLVSITLDPALTTDDLPTYSRYGVTMTTAEPLQDGAAITALIDGPEDCFSLTNVYWLRETYESVLSQAGFRRVAWRPLQLSQAGLHQYGWPYWRAFLAKPYGVILEGFK